MANELEVADRRLSIIGSLLDECKADYGDQWETFKYLDSKAQNIISVTGVFLAATLVFLRGASTYVSLDSSPWLVVTLAFAILFLLGSAIHALSALWLRSLTAPFDVAKYETTVDDLLALGASEFTTTKMESFQRQLIRQRMAPLESIRQATQRKGSRVFRGQVLLFVGVTLAGCFLLRIIAWHAFGC